MSVVAADPVVVVVVVIKKGGKIQKYFAYHIFVKKISIWEM